MYSIYFYKIIGEVGGLGKGWWEGGVSRVWQGVTLSNGLNDDLKFFR